MEKILLVTYLVRQFAKLQDQQVILFCLFTCKYTVPHTFTKFSVKMLSS